MTQTRAEKRRAKRKLLKDGKKDLVKLPDQDLDLVNPQSDNFPQFIFANACHADKVVEAGSGQGKTVVICGAGPSLAEDAKDYCHLGDEVWGCNSAAIWLHDNDYKITHAFTVDQQPHMVEEWYTAPDIEYLIASTCHPHLVEYLISKERSLTFFHNFVGLRYPPVVLCDCGHGKEAHLGGACVQCMQPTEGDDWHSDCEGYDERMMSYEDWMYSLFYESTVTVGAGLNSTTRAIDLASFMGFDRIILLGADCALKITKPRPDAVFGSAEHMKWLREGTIMHADGGHALASEATAVTLSGEIDGRYWDTKPDLMISSVWLVRMARAIPQLEIIGDTLPNALMDKDDDFLDQLPSLKGPDGNPQPFEVATANYHFKDAIDK